MSLTFSLSGTESVLSATYHPPINLNPRKRYALGLVSFNTFFTVPNLINKKFYYGGGKVIIIPNGYYDITDLEKLLKDKLGSDNIFLKAPTHSTKCELWSQFEVDFTPDDSLHKELGFKQQKYVKRNKIYFADSPVDLVKVKLIRIECNITSGSYHNHQDVHSLHHFAPNVGHAVAINEHPRNIIYLPVNVQTIHNITLRIVDQNRELLDFQKENIEIKLELKPWD